MPQNFTKFWGILFIFGRYKLICVAIVVFFGKM